VPADELASTVERIARSIAYSSPDILEIKKAGVNRMVEGAGFRSNILTASLSDSVLHGSQIGATRLATLGERGVRGANEQWSQELDEAVRGGPESGD
jgi:hypothetical protein